LNLAQDGAAPGVNLNPLTCDREDGGGFDPYRDPAVDTSSDPSRDLSRDPYRDPHRINADLHCHSYFSDGTLAPSEVVARAHRNGVGLLALTDHDDVSGLSEAAAAAAELGIAFIPGVEISVSWGGETIHVVGLRIDPNDADLCAGLASVRSGRDARAREMGAQLARIGLTGAFEGAAALAGNPALVSRTHFARWLVERGTCTDVRAVFLKYLVPGRPGYVPHAWARLSEAVSWIAGAGGVAVLAHPARYKLGELALSALVEEFRNAGGLAIEVASGSHTRDQVRRFARLALAEGLEASRGSDFHSPLESHADLGFGPVLPDSVLPVWHRWV